MTRPDIQEPRSERYNPHAIEQKWQEAWQASGLYTFDPQAPGEKHYALTMFPYPSGNLHIGHWYANVAPDAHARWMRMRGHNVLFPMGFDSFGLPAENAAIKRGVNPRSWTYDNIAHMKGQFGRMGTMIDWTRSFATSDPEYYRWNQWFFTQFFKRGLAYKKGGLVNWCPKDQTVLANEQVVGGACERCGTPVERRNLSQWYLKITDYADELLDFSDTDMPERVQLMQTNWIGKSVGAEVTFSTPAGPETVFTTRPDTLLGATFMVLAPEHAKVAELTTDEQRAAVEAYVAAAGRKTDVERQQEGEKTGVFTGSYATHPISGEPLPIWVADYVLVTYGTGSIMAVPAHDERDFAFARAFGLPIKEVIRAEGSEGMGEQPTEPYTGEGLIVNSGEFDGLPGGKASIAKVVERLEAQGIARAKTTYRLRDWLVGRQRYWGTPIPIIHCEKCGPQPVPDEQLPVRLPDDVEFTPTGQSPLKLDTEWVKATCPCCGGPAERDTDTMDTFVDSSWYMYRYLSPDYDGGPFDPAQRGLMPVDLYTGGIEHAILHLLYSRFWTKVMRDMGLTDQNEPFRRVRNQGMVLGEDGEKMSKSRGNVVDPDDLVAEYGADTVRTYLMFIAPWELGGPWDTKGINGPAKWLGRVWSLFFGGQPDGPREDVSEADLRYAVHSTLNKVNGDFERMSFNTIVAALMELTNVLVRAGRSDLYGSPAWDEALNIFNLMLAPVVPHIAEEVWQGRGGAGSVHEQSWPQVDESAAVRDTVTIGVQVTGKMRGQIEISKAASQDEALAAAQANPDIAKHWEGKDIVKVIYVPGRILNIVAK
ncbi:leucyl-tRNA synthetase [Deinococcus proteolyticus MRP]|uniref:Leucine--tRNA ligase n=1 Tax=Deinococcus proteolyticus (strain ATCC 35074 / DSM 20540 / JCM 6276 / NBRC 101906 / NCIMB 13154 / VKM Ac-1939 / CCM 2703 / MRP) TaxID=693977 RepID=F0RML4_DEIPM|nr:leucine--tRNA ligase [Deinococcus proteolyticus]ADY26064.1 leucyl-tRNA synthetase [Deinococcus proteolyticus MRP]